MRNYQKKMIRDWRDQIQAGDVLLNRRGKPRLVRAVSYKGPFLGCVTFAIKNCSWTKKPYTLKNRVDLIHAGYSPSGRKVEVNAMTLADKRLNRDISFKGKSKLRCCDVKGML